MRITWKSKVSRLTRLRLLHYPKTYGMSCASSVEIEDVSHQAPCRLHILNCHGTECASYEKVQDFRLNPAPAFALSKKYGIPFASTVEIDDVSHKAPCCLHVETLTVRNVRLTRKSKISRLTQLRFFHYPKTYGMSCASSVEIEDVSHKAPCRLHVPNSYGTECAPYEKV